MNLSFSAFWKVSLVLEKSAWIEETEICNTPEPPEKNLEKIEHIFWKKGKNVVRSDEIHRN